ncbi:MAG: arsenosugar biosynthesis radical SAM (seleno)protein ArsS [Gammaproteobacteria bacterium]
MHDVRLRLAETPFPALLRARSDTLQVNLGYLCNLACLHCHVAASPHRKEQMDRETAETVLEFLKRPEIETLDLTGGAPEMNTNFRWLVHEARAMGKRVMDRCNLTILEEPGYGDLGEFLARERVEIVASLPCYLEHNVDRQRGKGVYGGSIRMLQKLNAIGYGVQGSGLVLDLVYNPQDPVLPPAQGPLEADYRRYLDEHFGVSFNQLFVLANLPIGRFGSWLVSKGRFAEYMTTLRGAHRNENMERVMCRSLISVDWRGYVYDCDFNQMLDMPLGGRRTHLSELLDADLAGRPIAVSGHCYGCTAGQGSSCGGALM